MRKEDKGVIIEQLGEQLKAYPHFYLVDVTGMDAARTSSMRRTCFKNEIKMVVVKNTLLHKAFEASNIDFSPLYETLKGTTAVLFTQVANQPAKMLKDFVKGKETIPALKGAYAEEGFYVGADQLEALCAIKSKNCRDCGSAAVARQERRFCTSVWCQHHPRCAQDSRREGRIKKLIQPLNKQKI